MATEACYTIIHQDDSLDQPSLQELKTALEKGSEEAKIDTMKKILVTMLNGDPLPQILMHVIRFVMPSKNKVLKKLLHFYWEICPKTNPDGKLKQEMILGCDAPLPLQVTGTRIIGAIVTLVPFLFGIYASVLVKLNQDSSSTKDYCLLGTSAFLSSSSVKYEAATSLMALTHAPAAVKAAASCYIELIIKESDNNIKLIVLDRLDELREKHEQTMDDLVLDILRVLTRHVNLLSTGIPDIEVRRKALRIGLELVSSRNVQEVVVFLKKELSKTLDQDYEKNNEYRQLLIQSIHGCAIKFSEVAANVVHVLMEFLGDSNNPAAVDVIAFVREVAEKFPNLRSSITEKLLETFMDVKSGKVFRGALWIVGEYCAECKDIEEAWKQIRAGLGEIPILASEQRLLEEAEKEEKPEDASLETKIAGPSSSRRILADGTYATESIYSSNSTTNSKLDAVKAAAKPPLRALLLGGDFFLGTVLASTLTKLVMRYSEVSNDAKKTNSFRAEAMLIMASIIRVGQSQFVSTPIDEDSYDRIMSCLHVLEQLSIDASIKNVFLQDTKKAYTRIVEDEEKRTAVKKAKDKSTVAVQVDDLISFRQFSKRNLGDDADEYELDLTRATGQSDPRDDLISKLSRVVQLTGFSDPVYAEAYVNVHQYDILLDVLIVNQTSETLQNLSIEFATLGDLKLVERPTQHNLAPHSFHSVKATIKVSSTETGVIFGNIVYDGPGTAESNCVVLNDIHIDIMDYINPAYCNETQFRSMWTEFEWENKVNVNTNITDLRDYLSHIMKSTNMSCLTPENALSGDCGFLSANMYARSIFGEDALANISIEKRVDGAITGHVRIRSKTQGIALSLGDKITLAQKAAT
ncbi:1048_t:CDS:10 [Acaulospora colombiana]|uniref:1048_t:CDS:1 n=1 Tax=Acaulospora colombiana TaxID=27376 RepID=A0ACA9JYW8_9GLOM|nr:1048_t:CDS:10 [Acaulospora colombiana]